MRLKGSTAAVAAALAGVVVVGGAHPASPHGDTITFRVSLDRSGQVLALATYENDKDPVDDSVVGTLTAQSPEGRTLGPWRLVQVPHVAGGFTTRQRLSEGRWRITIRSAFPELGYGEGNVTVPKPVTPPPNPGERTKVSAASPTRPHQPADSSTTWTWITGAAVVMVVSALLAGYRRRR
ncbi:hypothetical protein ABZ864_09610 [Streptomyces sp. NPDC047082]|uniref:hypothetical protein n=1 Tax=Streptomyces sp. NPDC047082 TaxID=3155259 RepID=UPI0033E466C4